MVILQHYFLKNVDHTWFLCFVLFKDAILTHCWVSQSFNVLFKTCDAQREVVWQILLYF